MVNTFMKKINLILYYAFAYFLPMQPIPGYQFGYYLRYQLVKGLLKGCGKDVVIKNRCYFGNGERLTVGNRSQLGQGARLNGVIDIGDDVMMGPDVVMMATSHAYGDVNIGMNQQGAGEECPISIGDDVWVGTRAIILPGVTIGDHSIIGAGAVVTKSFPDYSIIAGNPARIVRSRIS